MLQPLLRPAAVAANDRLRGASPLVLPAPPALDLDFVGRPSLHYPGLPPISFARASTATRVNASGLIETVAADVPRFDHHPVTGARLGLLIEEARTNLILRSEDFAHAAWTKDNAMAAGAAAAPDGGTGTQALSEDSATGQHRARQTVGAAFAAGATLSVSCFLKAAGRGFATLQFGAADGFRACFDLGAGTLAPGFAGAAFGTGTFVSAGLQRFPGGWFRCWVVGKEDSAATLGEAYLNIARAPAYTDAYAGDGTSGILAWGYQVEAGAFPTSYVKTAGATVARSPDASYTDTTPWLNAIEGTLLAEGSPLGVFPAIGANQYIAQLNDEGTNTNVLSVLISNSGVDSGEPRFNARASGVTTMGFTSTFDWGVANRRRAITAYQTDNFAVAVSGELVGTDTSGAIPSGISRLSIGHRDTGIEFWNGYITRIAYWPRRLPNAVIQLLTR